MNQNPIICAVDTTDIGAASRIASQLQGEVGALKLGLEFFTAHGADGVRKLASMRAPVFLDLKFHDIPNTVAGAIRATAGIDTFMMTIHTQGGLDMMKAAVDASMEVAQASGKHRPRIIGVTMLTSLDEQDLKQTGSANTMPDQVKTLADLAMKAGLDGVVCSPKEITLLREHCGEEFTLVVPGIRPAGSNNIDQKRTMTPHEAIAHGADYIVVGRPITQSSDPGHAARTIRASLKKFMK